MASIFADRRANRPNRFKLTPDSGNEYYVTLERADEPTELGTPINAENLNRLLDTTGDTMTGGLTMAGSDYPTIYFDPEGGVGDSALEGGDRVISLHVRDKKGTSAPRRQLAVYAASARSNIAETVRLIDTDASGNKTYYYMYGEHHKPTAPEIGAIPADNNRTDIPEGANLSAEEYLKIGAWRATSSSRVASLTNCPVRVAFTMDVVAGTGVHTAVASNSGYIIQKITTQEGDQWFRRIYAANNGRVFDPWKTVIHTGNMHLYGLAVVPASLE